MKWISMCLGEVYYVLHLYCYTYVTMEQYVMAQNTKNTILLELGVVLRYGHIGNHQTKLKLSLPFWDRLRRNITYYKVITHHDIK